MKRLGELFNQLGKLAMILVLVWAVFLLTHEFVKTFSGLNPNVAAAIVAGGATALASVFSLVATRTLERSNQIVKEHREHKIPIYEDLIRFMARVQFANKLGNAPSQQEAVSFYSEFQQKLMVWGDDQVVKQFAILHEAWVKAIQERGTVSGSDAPMKEYEKLVMMIRKDLGHHNRGLKAGDILGLWTLAKPAAISEGR